MGSRATDPIIPHLSGKTTQGSVSSQGITYNEVGVAYNDSPYTYGGFYGFADVTPLLSLAQLLTPRLNGARNSAAIEEQGITHNESGVSYSDARYLYGGIFGYTDVIPIISLAGGVVPRIVGYADVYVSPSTNSGMLIGILGLTYP